jgi:hypothetical protein
MGKEKKKAWKQKQCMMKPGDGVMDGGKPTDIVIPFVFFH